MSPALRNGATGFGLLAVCYGFARFACGLLLPQIDGDPNLGPSLSGIISGGAFAGYGIAVIASAALTEWIGARGRRRRRPRRRCRHGRDRARAVAADLAIAVVAAG